MGAARRNSRRRSRRPLQVGAPPSVAQASHEPSAGGPTPASAYSAAGPAVSLGSALQRTEAGSGDRMIRMPSEGVVHPVAAKINRSGTHFRVPNFADFKAAYTSKTLAIPESVFKDRVARLLGRMAQEWIGIVDQKGNKISRLKTMDDVPTIMSKIFPAPGVIDKAEFENAVDVTNRRMIYENVLEADTKVKPVDQPKVKTLMADASALITTVESDAAGLTAVFGTKAPIAKKNYGAAKKALDAVAKNIDKRLTTDYNLDDPEIHVGGLADFANQSMHLMARVVSGTDPNDSKTAMIHEASHLADSTVSDKGYYGSTNFEAVDETVKITNAAHYEELPRRALGTSKYPGLTFTPNVNKSGAPVTWEDEIRRAASEFMRSAWDAAVNTHDFIRSVRIATVKGNNTLFASNKARILEISKVMDLTIHEQAPAAARVTSLDVTLSEGVTRGVYSVWKLAEREPVIKPNGLFSTKADEDKAARDLVVDAAAAKFGQLLGDPARDRKLLDWLFAHFIP